MGDPISGLNRASTTKTPPPQESNHSIFDKRWIEEPEGLTPAQLYNHWMNENTLQMEMGIPLVPYPKHTFSKIHGLSESESFDWEEEFDELLQLRKEEDVVPSQAASDSNKDVQDDLDSSPTLVIYSTPEGRTMRWEKTGLHNRSTEISDLRTDELPFQRGAPLDLPKAEDNEDIEDLCREVLMV